MHRMNLFDVFRSPSKPQAKPKKSTLQFEGLEVVVHRRARRRTMTIQMGPGEPIKVLTAMRITDADVLNFLKKKSKWIQKNVHEFAQRPQPLVRTGQPGEMWMYLGRELILQEAITLLAKPFVRFNDTNVMIYWPEKMWRQRELMREQAVGWIEAAQKAEAEKLFKARVGFFAEQMQLFPNRIRLMRAETRWGSCSSRRNLNLNWRLMGAPLEVIDAIIVHEISHLKHMNHSAVFWDLVAVHAPHHDWADEWLKKHQHLL